MKYSDLGNVATTGRVKYETIARYSGTPYSGPVTADTPGAYAVAVSAHDNVSRENVSAGFALPPADNVFQDISPSYNLSLSDTQTAAEVFHQALIDKYGPPLKEEVRGRFDQHIDLTWFYPPDGVECMQSNERSRYLGDCATMLRFSIRQDRDGLVETVTGGLGNPGYSLFNDRLKRRWVRC